MKHFISRRNFLKAAGVTAAASAMAAAVPQASAGFLTGKDAAVTILYTNDVHTYIDNKSPKLTYAAIAAMKQGYVDEGKPVLLVDAGDHIQGTACVSCPLSSCSPQAASGSHSWASRPPSPSQSPLLLTS